jgi:hypothetical protein
VDHHQSSARRRFRPRRPAAIVGTPYALLLRFEAERAKYLAPESHDLGIVTMTRVGEFDRELRLDARYAARRLPGSIRCS